MRRIYQAAHLLEAQILVDRLGMRGIRAEIFNGNALSAAGGIPVTDTYPEVWILDDADYPLARNLLDQYEAELRQPPRERRCPHCGEMVPANFASCWHCQRDLDPAS
ncbi:MAG: putative signal transducing protein [Pseudomonadota bacterium]|uniref:putative signal transducing protein n=1 Tax=Thermithiobacillus tepidarius TaxID=929 RepID=UPI0004146AFC|nr:DUF2007 domain-containing protein [Thermithiobacillus tepidarius]